MSKVERAIVHEALDLLLDDGKKHTVTGFFPPLSNVTKRVRVTRAVNGNGIHIDIGEPNYREREFLKLCKKAKCNPKRFWIHMLKAR